MIDNIINELKDKKVIILGFGREGQATYKLMRKYLKNQLIYIGDLNESIKDNILSFYYRLTKYISNYKWSIMFYYL